MRTEEYFSIINNSAPTSSGPSISRSLVGTFTMKEISAKPGFDQYKWLLGLLANCYIEILKVVHHDLLNTNSWQILDS